MKKFISGAFLALVAGCMDATEAEMSESAGLAVTTEAQFRSDIVGRTLTFNGNSVTFNADGTLSGPWDGQGISGTWGWDDGAVCREAAIGSRQLDPDCQTFVLDGDTTIVTRNRGEGASFTYSIS